MLGGLIMALGGAYLHAADQVVISGREPLTGTFNGVSAGQLAFSTPDGQTHKWPQARVENLRLDPPATVNLRRRGGRNLDGWTLTGFTKPHYLLTGPDGEVSVPGGQVVAIDVQDAFGRAMKQATATPIEFPSATDAEGNLLLPTGRVCVVHIHMEGVVSSTRQGQYARTLAQRRRVEYRQVHLPDWQAPFARRHDIRSAPQFWFFDAEGNRVRALTDRFTEADLEEAIRALP